LVKYAAASCTPANGAKLTDAAAASDGKSVQNLHLEGASLTFDQVGGAGADGRATISIHYAAEGTAKLKLYVNGIDYSFLNTPATGGWDSYSGRSQLTVTLGPGATNSIRLVGGNGGVNVDYVTVCPL
jgi:hypothetical protein